MHSRLPEPPEVRERLKSEIKLFIESIREKAKRSGGCVLIFAVVFNILCQVLPFNSD